MKVQILMLFDVNLKNNLNDDNDDSLLNDQKSKSNLTIRSRLPPTPKRQINTKFHSNVSPSSMIRHIQQL